MSHLQKPKNSWSKALFILYDSFMGGVSMAKILTQYDSTFYKFQTRLLEIEDAHPKLKVSRVSIPYVSRIDGKNKHYIQYTLLSPPIYVRNLYNLINEKGLVGSISENSKKVA
jgi:hypothetical protein